MNAKRRNIVLALAAVVVAFGAAMLLWRQPAGITSPPKKVLLGVDFSDAFSSPVLVAENRGYFRDEGLDVKIVEYPSGRTALADMVSKKNLDVVTVAQTPVMYNSFDSGSYAIIAGMASSYEAGCVLLARKDRGISTVADLKGRKIGTPVGSTGHFFLNLFLTYNGMQIQDVQLVDIDATHLPQALAEGRVSAIAIWQPQAYNARKLLGEKAVILPSRDIYRVDFYLVADKAFLGENTEALKGLVRAVARAEDFITKNREGSIDIVSGRMKMDRGIVAAIWDQYQFRVFLDQAILTDLEAEGRWAIKNRHTKATALPDYRNIIYPGILESVKPGAVNIIR